MTLSPITLWRRLTGASVSELPAGFRAVPDYYGRSHRKQVDIRTLPVFGELASEIIAQKRSYLYYDRLYTLFQGVQNLRRLDPGLAVAEVGVFRGGGSRFMSLAMERGGVGVRPIHCFDTFEGHAAEDIHGGKDDSVVHVPEKFGNTSLAEVRACLADRPMMHFHQGRIQDTAHEVESLRFGLVHLDVDLYEPTLFGLDFFYRRLAPGGMIIVDDFDCTTCPGTRQAVDEFVGAGAAVTVLALLSAQCVLVKHD